MLIPNPLLIDPDPLNRQHTIPRLQPPRIELIVWHDEPEHNPQHCGQAPIHEKHNLPPCDRRRVLLRAHRDAIRDEATKNLTPAIETEPKPGARALLLLRVPLGCEEGEAGRDGRLEDAEEEADRNRAAVVVHGGEAGQHRAPHEDAEGGVLGQGQALEEAVGRPFPGEVAEVEEGPEPLVVVADEVEVLFDAHDGGVREGRFVEVVEAVDHAHERDEVQVDGAEESLVGGFVDFDDFAVLEGCHGLVGVVGVLHDLLFDEGGVALLGEVDGRGRAVVDAATRLGVVFDGLF